MRRIVILTTVFVLLLSSTSFARGNELNVKVDTLVDYMNYVNEQMGYKMSKSEISEQRKNIEKTIKEYAEEQNISVDQAADAIIEEVESEINMYSGRSSGGGDARAAAVQLPSASKGNVFFTDNSAPYNHVGLYTASNKIVEAPGTGEVVHHELITDQSTYQSVSNNSQSCVMSVSGLSTSEADDVANWAIAKVDKEYDLDFLNNKKFTTAEDEKYNCSELVWKAFKSEADINLDSNGGLAVYPNNIYNSNLTTSIEEY